MLVVLLTKPEGPWLLEARMGQALVGEAMALVVLLTKAQGFDPWPWLLEARMGH